MSWTDALKNVIGGAEQSLVAKYLTPETLQAILAKLEEAGLGAQVKSWLDQNRDNIPVSGEQLKAALGDQRLQEWAGKFGVSSDMLASVLAQVLPNAAAAAGPAAAPPAPPSAT